MMQNKKGKHPVKVSYNLFHVVPLKSRRKHYQYHLAVPVLDRIFKL